MKLTPFHIAIPVRDISESRRFYAEILGCEEGRSAKHWVDFNLYGHQLVCHLNPNIGREGKVESHYNPVDGQGVPVPHYGVVLEMEDWEALATQLKEQGIEFVIEPSIRFKGKAGEQATMFFRDPSGNALEFKAFKDLKQLFAA
ncbi:MAG: VOC family protein [Leptolyngbyaceae cyanobacterium]